MEWLLQALEVRVQSLTGTIIYTIENLKENENKVTF